MSDPTVPTPGAVLIVEDDPELAALVAAFLVSHGYAAAVEPRGDRAAARILAERPQAVVLDLMLPGCDGMTVCRQVRPHYDGAIVMLTARGDEIDEVVGLELGADDYLAKPVRPRVLLARLAAAVRRRVVRAAPSHTPARRLDVGRLSLDLTSREVLLDGAPVDLTTAEFDLLRFLAEHAGEVIERDALYEQVRGIAWDGEDRSIDLRISRLRRKLGDADKPHRLIKSVRGTGYLLAVNP